MRSTDMRELIKNFILKIRLLFSHGEVHYINGSETLPAPLPPEEEESWLEGLVW